MHKHTVAVAMATTAAIGAFALLPMTAAMADDAPQPVQLTSEPSDPPTDHPGTTDGTQSDDPATDDGPSAGAPATAAVVRHVDAKALDSDRVLVTWRLSDGDASAITGFQVELASSVGGAVDVTADATATSVVVATLAPDTRYQATVTPVLSTGTATSASSGWTHTDRSRLGKAAEKADRDAQAAQKTADRLAKAAAKAAQRARHAAEHASKAAARAAAKQAASAAKQASNAAHAAKELARHAHAADVQAAHEQHADQQDESPESTEGD